MYKMWGKIMKRNQIQSDLVIETQVITPYDTAQLKEAIITLCRMLDLSVPVLLQTHMTDFRNHGRTVFRTDDFIEHIDFDNLTVEIFTDKKKGAKKQESGDRSQ